MNVPLDRLDDYLDSLSEEEIDAHYYSIEDPGVLAMKGLVLKEKKSGRTSDSPIDDPRYQALKKFGLEESDA